MSKKTRSSKIALGILVVITIIMTAFAAKKVIGIDESVLESSKQLSSNANEEPKGIEKSEVLDVAEEVNNSTNSEEELTSQVNSVSPSEGVSKISDGTGRTLYVGMREGKEEGKGEEGEEYIEDGTAEFPYGALKDAIEAAEDGDKIYIMPGVYNLIPMIYDNYAGVGIWDMGKQLEIYGDSMNTVLIYHGSDTTRRDGSAMTLANENTVVRNFVYKYYPEHNSYSGSIFRGCNGRVENVFFRIIGDENNRGSYIYSGRNPCSTELYFFP